MLVLFWSVLAFSLTGCVGFIAGGYVELNPGPVRAGEDACSDVVLDRAPNFEGGEIRMTAAGPPNSNAILTAKEKALPGKKIYHVCIHIPPAAPGGNWSFTKVAFFTGAQEYELRSSNKSFQVVANPNIVLPTSAEVTVTLSQAQLLRTEAAQLQLRLQLLKANLTMAGGGLVEGGSVTETLSKKIEEELRFLATTEAKFRSLSDSEQKPNVAASVFFADLRAGYEEVRAQVTGRTSIRLESRPSFPLVGISLQQNTDQKPRYPVLAQAVFRVFEQNELAYLTVANVGTLTFDLEVASSPEEAVISYRRRGDSYRQHPDQTNSIIKALPFAIWTVRLQKQGYRDEEREHDPFREPNHVINVQLKK